MPTDFPASTPRLPARHQAEARRFVPTLTEVVHLDAQTPEQAQLPTDAEAVVVPEVGPTSETLGRDTSTEQLVSRACAIVLQGLDDHIRAVVTQAMQTQQLLLVQSLRGQLAPVVEALVRDAVAGETAQAARQNGDDCIQTTD
jgi:hypothetical protein